MQQPATLKNNGSPILWGGLFSILLNATGIAFLYQMQDPARSIVLLPAPETIVLDISSEVQKSYIDTPKTETLPEEQADLISDKDSHQSSSFEGEEQDLLPKGDIEDLSIQAARHARKAANSSPGLQSKQMERNRKAMEREDDAMREFSRTEEVTLLTEKEIENMQEAASKPTTRIMPDPIFPTTPELMNLDVSLIKTPVPDTTGTDPFPMPFISMGGGMQSEKGVDAFNAVGTPLGSYTKRMRDKIGLQFYEMIYFQYRTNHFMGSRANIEFLIEPSGFIRGVTEHDNHGDPLFSAYCRSVIQNAGPFAPMDESLAPYLEDGVLKMNILFGYDVRQK